MLRRSVRAKQKLRTAIRCSVPAQTRWLYVQYPSLIFRLVEPRLLADGHIGHVSDEVQFMQDSKCGTQFSVVEYVHLNVLKCTAVDTLDNQDPRHLGNRGLAHIAKHARLRHLTSLIINCLSPTRLKFTQRAMHVLYYRYVCEPDCQPNSPT